MDNLYSMDQHRISHQQNIENEIEGYRLINLAKGSRSSSPGTTGRFFIRLQTFVGNFVSRLRCSIAQNMASFNRKSNVEIEPC